MEHFAPHPKSIFEGYYSKFDLPSGAHIALIICRVPKATTLPPYMVSFTYYPRDGFPIFQREHWVSSIEFNSKGAGHAFELHIPDMGSMAVDADSTTTYDLECEDWCLEAMTAGRTSWRGEKETPEGWLVHLPLPLHWHVHSLCSPASFRLDIPVAKLPRADQTGCATVHQEKNWANSFPESHVWIQAYDADADRGICVAGGKILGMQAFILGYRSPSRAIDVLPPFALSFFGISPFMSVDIDDDNRSMDITMSNFWYRVKVRAKAPTAYGWFGLGSPFPEGHKRNFCTESFVASVHVEVSERSFWGWREAEKEQFEGASLEFAGGYFKDRGVKGD
jgi:tocopherol cyclase